MKSNAMKSIIAYIHMQKLQNARYLRFLLLISALFEDVFLFCMLVIYREANFFASIASIFILFECLLLLNFLSY